VARVLVVDDDPALLRALRLALGAAGHQVVTAVDGAQGLVEATRATPEVIILDLGLPDIDGMTVCRRIRGWSEVPIIVLSATRAEDRKVAALDEGADDYVTKPFGMAELEARIRAALRHRPGPGAAEPEVLTVGDLEVDLLHRQAELGGSPVELTSKEFDVLAFLVSHPGKVCTHQMILGAVWGTTYSKEAQYLHAYIHRLRQKLGDDSGVVIKTAPGIGYLIASEEPPVTSDTRRP
jgi:two-component system KDP operon response regulator KdpE